MPIYRMVTPAILSSGDKPWYLEAEDLATAKRTAGRGGVVRPWRFCMAPRHRTIPEAGTSRHSRNYEARVLHDGLPHCSLCLKHALMTLEEKVENLERVLVELLDDFELHGDRHGEED